MGKPTVASDNGGIPDAVIDGVTGFVVQPGNVEAMAEGILKLLLNEELSKKFGNNGRKRVEDHFDVEKNLRIMESLFNNVLNKTI